MKLTRSKLKDIIELHEMGRDIEQIMFSIGMEYEEEEEND